MRLWPKDLSSLSGDSAGSGYKSYFTRRVLAVLHREEDDSGSLFNHFHLGSLGTMSAAAAIVRIAENVAIPEFDQYVHGRGLTVEYGRQ